MEAGRLFSKLKKKKKNSDMFTSRRSLKPKLNFGDLPYFAWHKLLVEKKTTGRRQNTANQIDWSTFRSIPLQTNTMKHWDAY